MTKRKSVVTQKKADTDKNPSGIEQKIQLHHERERKGHFVVPDVKPPTMIFVKNGRSEQKAIENYIKKNNTKQVISRRWEK